MAELLLLSNNPLLLEEAGDIPTRPVPGRGLEPVLRAALELVQSGYRLLSTPLPPNVPLIRAPYRSLLLERQGRQYDARGIIALEKAAQSAAALGTATYGETPALDSAFIDREILRRSLRECGYADSEFN